MTDTNYDAAQSGEDRKTAAKKFAKSRRSPIIGAIFLMATSAIGPGFITQTATFTLSFGAAFGFAILISILVDFAVQMNIWRIVTVSGKRAGQLANEALPGAGHVLGVLIIVGGLAFNIGNVAGGGLGINAMLGIDAKLGGLITALLAICIFAYKKAGPVMDKVVLVLGVAMIVLTIYVAIVSAPPVGEALKQTVLPDTINWASITTIVGGTVGGYITYSGAHRFLDSGQTGPDNVKSVHRASMNGIIVTGIMRYVLFLAILGVAASGFVLDTTNTNFNPAGQAFQYVLGTAGLRIFGVILWAASISSVIGAAYTSATFLSVFDKRLHEGLPLRIATIAFIAVSMVCYLIWGAAPANILVFVGGLNGLILPIGLTIFMYIGWFRQKSLLQGYAYPRWLLTFGTAATLLSWYMAIVSIGPIFELLG
ncbi:NRAMP family divalent metal transporter [Propionimicrobium sp. PCR01-08-3]|uniref:NRAMP family divalent metal transporter n=1 Tax=Propionimicrobium sp. PCR01-08-3 TaxID=3052086 RepID=UPI00255C3137|nr:NRAMP family divalent metal transporter [Propionimicrobium sp. PCR01-08-3]WIY82456.1 divalent metal cation transporter [Propionimicrobium sp. PCR01-08-3]